MTSLSELDGIGVDRLACLDPKRVAGLAAVGVTSVLDLLTYYPRRYVDRTNLAPIAALVEGEELGVVAKVRRITSRPTRQRRTMVVVDVTDGRGYLSLTFFNQPWRARQLHDGMEVVVFGRVERFRGRLQMTNPVVDLVGDRTGRIVAIYPQSEKAGVLSEVVARAVAEALDRFAADLVDPLPAPLRAERALVERGWALRATHLPETAADHARARKRLGFDELLRLQLVVLLRKAAIERDSVGILHSGDPGLLERFEARLPFALTAAQAVAVEEVRADMTGPHPMHRLLQGDVGSGKTVVAVAALLTAVVGGHQGALMAPTEVLAEQHYEGISHLLAGLEVPAGPGELFADRPLTVELLTNRTTAAERRRLHARLEDGTVDLLVGTHALLAERVAFADLGAVVIDEQHRFGVEQRSVLREKGRDGAVPDVLVMTATPIPRTLAMTVFGDLDVTVLDELPPGRTPITTVWARGDEGEAEAWAAVRAEVDAGRQAYVVCPLVDGSERVAARSATEELERLSDGPLAGLTLGLLHGQMPPAVKDEVMADFRQARIDVLVATTVIEVGVDVPNASVMVIEDAGRFGIAQLHQLRGRVGRGAAASWCYLLGDGGGEGAPARLEALVESTDGFRLAETDLDLRGAGTILGARQKGVSDLKLASLRRHRKTVADARETARQILAADPDLRRHPDLAEELSLLVDEEDRAYLFRG